MTAHRLPCDRARCQGLECEERETCLRFLALADMGPATSQHETMQYAPGMCDARIEPIATGRARE